MSCRDGDCLHCDILALYRARMANTPKDEQPQLFDALLAVVGNLAGNTLSLIPDLPADRLLGTICETITDHTLYFRDEAGDAPEETKH